MKHAEGPAERVVALEIRARRLGYVVLERPAQMLECGVARYRGVGKHLEQASHLLATFQASVVVLHKLPRRTRRNKTPIQKILRAVRRRAEELSIPAVLVSDYQLRQLFRRYAKRNKQEIAMLIAAAFPELGWRLPPPRKPWQREDHGMVTFEATALALTFLSCLDDAQEIHELLKAASPFAGSSSDVAK